MKNNPALAAIEYALKDEEGLLFLKLWYQGDFDILRKEWQNIPDNVFLGADPTFKISKN